MSPLERLAWVRRIAGTPGMVGSPLAVAVALTEYINKDTSDARPSVGTLAAKLHLDQRTVQRSVRALEVAGLLTVHHPAGRACCTYSPNPGSGARVEPRQQRQGLDAPTPAAVASNPGRLVPQPRQQRHPNRGEQGIEQGCDEPRAKPSPGGGDSMREDETDSLGPIFLLKSGVDWRCRRGLLDTFAQAFPGVDLDAELRKAAAWCATEPTRRKTAAGMDRFLRSWLGRARPTADTEPAACMGPTMSSPDADWDAVRELDAEATP